MTIITYLSNLIAYTIQADQYATPSTCLGSDKDYFVREIFNEHSIRDHHSIEDHLLLLGVLLLEQR